MVEALLVINFIALIALIALVWKTRGMGEKDIEAAVSKTWVMLGLGERIMAVEMQAKQIRDSYRSFEQLLRAPTERASLGEMSLETMLADQLPQDMYTIRQRIFDGKIPDAAIRSTVGIICIDCKFPLDNYQRMVAAGNESATTFKRQFLRNVSTHLDKIARDYVCPEKGSAEFAFAYIPSEAIYYFLVNEGFDLLRSFTKRGVQVVSPLTLSHKLELIKAGVHARRLSENAEKVRREIYGLSGRFAEVDDAWRVFYRTHLKNLTAKAEDLDMAYSRVRKEFDRISLSGGEE